MNATPRPRVLVIGLDPHRVPGPWDPRPLARAIEAGMARFAEHGIDAESCLIPLDGSADPGKLIEEALRAQRWDCVTVGGGLRHSDDHVELLEQTIDAIRRLAPDAPIAFNGGPDGTYDAAARWLD